MHLTLSALKKGELYRCAGKHIELLWAKQSIRFLSTSCFKIIFLHIYLSAKYFVYFKCVNWI